MIRVFLTGLFFVTPQLVFAADSTASDSLLIPALKMLGALAVVIGLMLLIYAASRKGFGILSRRQDGQIRMLETRPLGGKKFLCLVQVGDQELLLGVSNERIECLTQLSAPVSDTDFATTLALVETPEEAPVPEAAS